MSSIRTSTTTPPALLLTGRPGCGKTTAIRRAVDRIGPARCAGFYTEEVREGGTRIGFDVVTLDGRRGPLARAGAPGPRVGRYGVDVTAFEALGVDALARGLDRRVSVLVVDEIGKMELLSPRFRDLLDRIFDPTRAWVVLGTLLRGRHPKADLLRRRGDVRIIEVTPANRAALPERLSTICIEILTRKGS